jgi:hypothetical protein
MEEPGTFNPPTDRYSFMHLQCNPATNDVDARETGQILSFIISSYGQLQQKKLIFCHAHDNSWHLGERSIWFHIDHLVRTDYFWESSFGNVMRCYITDIFFRPNDEGLRCQMDEDTWWMNMTDIAYFLFAGTTFMNVPWTSWASPCCSTFFMNSDLILKHPKEDYVILLKRLRTAVKLGYCRLFQRRSCVDNATFIEDSPNHWNFVMGGVLERAWGPMFTRLSNQVWNLTRTG